MRRYATGPLRPLARHVFDRLVSFELAADRRCAGPGPDATLDTQLTALIKTFERPRTVRRLIASIRRRYPTLPIIVADDSRQPEAIAGTDYVILPHDSGVSAGRQAGLDRVTTPFVLVLDDDFVFSETTDLALALGHLRARPPVDILGGQLIDLPFLRQLPPPVGKIFPTTARPLIPIGSLIDGLRVCDKVMNFYVARTDRLRLVGWDPALRRIDHADFFTRALGVLVSVFDPELQAFHAQTPFDRAYMASRMDIAADQRLLATRWGRKLAPLGQGR
jgi:glycosyltransferase involved in cell wall biosynthesis